MNDLHISGSGSISSGEYNKVTISGSGTGMGNVACEELRVSGSARIDGDLTARSLATASGALKVEGNLRCGQFKASGSARVGGGVECAGEMKVSGSARVGGGVRAQSVRISGQLSTGSDVACEEFRCSGAFAIEGLLNAERAHVSLGGRCSATEIGGETVEVVNEFSINLLSVFGWRLARLKADVIEATTVKLVNTEAGVVRGAQVEIGPGCRIGRVEYTGSLLVDPQAQVSEQQKT